MSSTFANSKRGLTYNFTTLSGIYGISRLCNTLRHISKGNLPLSSIFEKRDYFVAILDALLPIGRNLIFFDITITELEESVIDFLC